MKIYIKRFNKNIELPTVIAKGDWIDLRASKTIKMHAPQAKPRKAKMVNQVKEYYRNVDFDFQLIPLGIAMKLQGGLEAWLVSRSGTYNKFGIIQANSKGIIDYTYQGNEDEWKYPAIAFRDTLINEGDRICQFRIALSQKATFWQKLRWMLSSKIEIVEVDSLDGPNRGGFNSTGIK